MDFLNTECANQEAGLLELHRRLRRAMEETAEMQAAKEKAEAWAGAAEGWAKAKAVEEAEGCTHARSPSNHTFRSGCLAAPYSPAHIPGHVGRLRLCAPRRVLRDREAAVARAAKEAAEKKLASRRALALAAKIASDSRGEPSKEAGPPRPKKSWK